MRIVLLGAPGSGKGTQAKMMAEAYRVPQISTGDILRKAVADKTEDGKKVAAMMDAGGTRYGTIPTQKFCAKLTDIYKQQAVQRWLGISMRSRNAIPSPLGPRNANAASGSQPVHAASVQARYADPCRREHAFPHFSQACDALQSRGCAR